MSTLVIDLFEWLYSTSFQLLWLLLTTSHTYPSPTTTHFIACIATDEGTVFDVLAYTRVTPSSADPKTNNSQLIAINEYV